jgi:predicted RNase H-like HicB family nuclease
MATLTYPARVQRKGKVLVAVFIDMPEAVTQSESLDELLENCAAVLERMLSDFMRRKRAIPRASAATGDDIVHVRLSSAFANRIEKYVTERQGHISTIDGGMS